MHMRHPNVCMCAATMFYSCQWIYPTVPASSKRCLEEIEDHSLQDYLAFASLKIITTTFFHLYAWGEPGFAVNLYFKADFFVQHHWQFTGFFPPLGWKC